MIPFISRENKNFQKEHNGKCNKYIFYHSLQMERILNDMMINSPNNVKRSKSQKNNEFKRPFAPEKIERNYKENSCGEKDEII
jgi:hypothetical protein